MRNWSDWAFISLAGFHLVVFTLLVFTLLVFTLKEPPPGETLRRDDNG